MRSPQHTFCGKDTSEAKPDLVTIARVTRTRGRHGEVVATVLTSYPDRFENISKVYFRRNDGELLRLELDDHWFHQGRLILHFCGYDSIEQAEELVGGLIKIDESELVELDEDEYFHFQLIGCEVLTTSNERVGQVFSIMETAGGAVLVVTDANQQEYLIPFVKSICPDVNILSKQIRIDPPDGLLDL